MLERIPDRADVLVVGAGTGGATAARVAAAQGANVLLIDKLAAGDVGRKVCGNAIADDGLAAVVPYSDPPHGAEVARHLAGGTLVLPDGETTVPMPKAGVILNRLVYGQRLLAEAIAAGALFLDGCACVDWSDRASGRVRVRRVGGDEAEITARVVIDASGYRAILTRSGGPSHPDPLTRDDVGIGYREITPLTEPLDDPDDALIVLAPQGATAGYAWSFPMGERLTNIGVGAPLASVGGNLRSAYRSFVKSHPELSVSSPIEAASGLLPLRRPLASMVGDRFMTVGDAGCQTNPLHGGGITPSLIGGGLAGETAAAALADGDTSARALWSYNGRFMEAVGARHVAHELLRRFVYSLGAGDFHYLTLKLARAGVMQKALAEDRPRLPIREALQVLAIAARRPGLVLSFLRAGRLIEATQRLYADYPATPATFDSWMGHVESHLRAMSRFTAGGHS
jgi:geranylgeranyl reductase family protein